MEAQIHYLVITILSQALIAIILSQNKHWLRPCSPALVIASWNLVLLALDLIPPYLSSTRLNALHTSTFMLMTFSSPAFDLLNSVRIEFAIKDLGPLYFFLSREAITTFDGFLLSQQCYILDLLKKSNMSEAKPIKTPLFIANTLSLFNGDPFLNPSTYRSLVGTL